MRWGLGHYATGTRSDPLCHDLGRPEFGLYARCAGLAGLVSGRPAGRAGPLALAAVWAGGDVDGSGFRVAAVGIQSVALRGLQSGKPASHRSGPASGASAAGLCAADRLRCAGQGDDGRREGIARVRGGQHTVVCAGLRVAGTHLHTALVAGLASGTGGHCGAGYRYGGGIASHAWQWRNDAALSRRRRECKQGDRRICSGDAGGANLRYWHDHVPALSACA